MSEYSQAEVDRLAAEVKTKLRERADILHEMATALNMMSDRFQPGLWYDDLRHMVEKEYPHPWTPRTNGFGEIYLAMGHALELIRACNDEHSGLLWEQSQAEEVAS